MDINIKHIDRIMWLMIEGIIVKADKKQSGFQAHSIIHLKNVRDNNIKVVKGETILWYSKIQEYGGCNLFDGCK